jgi:hypothetical protein
MRHVSKHCSPKSSKTEKRREEERERERGERREKESSMMILTGEKNLEPKPHFPKFHMKSAQF